MNSNKKNILLTFDYELSLGYRSGTVQNCMIKPTELILDILKKHKLKAIFFIDTTSIFMMQNLASKHSALQEDIQDIKIQVGRMIKEGHYVFHHLHPHWLDAVYIKDEKQWDLSNMKKYSLHSLVAEETNKLFDFSTTLLNNWCVPLDSSYKPEGFRAGGLFLQPFNVIKPFFKKYNIKYDFSVMKEAVCDIGVAKYDYRLSVNSDFYSFDDNLLKPIKNGAFVEYSIPMIENKGVYKILNGIWYRLKKHNAFADGQSIVNTINIKKNKINFSGLETFSFELMNPVKNLLYFKEFKEKSFVHFISHPKHTSLENIKSADIFFERIKEKYTIETDFKCFNQNNI